MKLISMLTIAILLATMSAGCKSREANSGSGNGSSSFKADETSLSSSTSASTPDAIEWVQSLLGSYAGRHTGVDTKCELTVAANGEDVSFSDPETGLKFSVTKKGLTRIYKKTDQTIDLGKGQCPKDERDGSSNEKCKYYAQINFSVSKFDLSMVTIGGSGDAGPFGGIVYPPPFNLYACMNLKKVN